MQALEAKAHWKGWGWGGLLGDTRESGQSIDSVHLMVSSGFPGLCRIVLCLHGHILPHGPREQTGLRKLLEVAARITESTVNWLGQDLGVFPCDHALFNPCTYMHAYALRPATLHTLAHPPLFMA